MWAVSALREVGGDGHSGPRGGSEAAHDAAPICRHRGLGMNIHMAYPLTCPRDVTMGRLHPTVHLQGASAGRPRVTTSVQHPKWLRWSTFPPTPLKPS